MESVLVGFDSCDSCGGDCCLWWINGLTIRGKRKRCLWKEVIDCDLKRKKQKFRVKEEEEVEGGQKIGMRDEIRTKKKKISTKENIKRQGQNKNINIKKNFKNKKIYYLNRGNCKIDEVM